MPKYLTSTLAAAASVLALGGLAGTASAMPVAKHQTVHSQGLAQVRHEARRFDGDRHFEGRRHFRRGPVLFFGSGIQHDDCFWLKRRAYQTGSRYWWHRYHECRIG